MENKNSTEDLKTLRNYVIGVAGFATTVSAILIQVFHFKAEPTVACAIAFACMMLLIVYLIGRAEKRNQVMLQSHIDESNTVIGGFDKRLDSIDNVLLDIQKSTLRTELSNEINRNPSNHDTIIRMGEKYFCRLNGNWVMLDAYKSWMESEEKTGRKVHLPTELLTTFEQNQKKSN